MNDTIRLLKRSYISPDEFLSRTETLEGNFFPNANVFTKFIRIMKTLRHKKGIMDLDDISIKAVEASRRARIFEDIGIIVIDGFINIDPVNLNLVRNIMNNHPDIPIHVNVPFKNFHNQEFVLYEIIKNFEELGFERVEDQPGKRKLKLLLFRLFPMLCTQGETA